jgi:hypothetical protein
MSVVKSINDMSVVNHFWNSYTTFPPPLLTSKLPAENSFIVNFYVSEKHPSQEKSHSAFITGQDQKPEVCYMLTPVATTD